MTGLTTKRGYGFKHQDLRKRLLPRAIGTPCSRCGKPMTADQALDLDHTEDRRGYLGFSHSSCNRRAAGQKRKAQSQPSPQARPATQW